MGTPEEPCAGRQASVAPRQAYDSAVLAEGGAEERGAPRTDGGPWSRGVAGTPSDSPCPRSAGSHHPDSGSGHRRSPDICW